mmetsp:Transcript_56187/g.133403  ORF Transcript_56187/g.133403 Transcript_56187/m.133403 type:complete len:390 (-) Transcript_56187:2096-3265(-)
MIRTTSGGHCAGMIGRRSRVGSATSFRTCPGSSSAYGSERVYVSKSVMPNAYTSLCTLFASPLRSSGAIQNGVPHGPDAANFLAASPKSETLPLNCASTSTLAALTSPCTMGWWCRKLRPCATWRRIGMTSSPENSTVQLWIKSCSDPCSISSMTSIGSQLLWITAPITVVMQGWRSLLTCRISCTKSWRIRSCRVCRIGSHPKIPPCSRATENEPRPAIFIENELFARVAVRDPNHDPDHEPDGRDTETVRDSAAPSSPSTAVESTGSPVGPPAGLGAPTTPPGPGAVGALTTPGPWAVAPWAVGARCTPGGNGPGKMEVLGEGGTPSPAAWMSPEGSLEGLTMAPVAFGESGAAGEISRYALTACDEVPAGLNDTVRPTPGACCTKS